MDGPGQRRLSGAAFPLEQDDGLGGGGLPGGLDDPLHGGVRALEPHRRGPTFLVRLQCGDLRFQPPDPADAPGQQPDLIRRERFGNIVLGPAPHGLHRAFDGGVGRDDHDLYPGRIRQQAGDQVHAVFRPQPQVDECQIERPPFRLGLGVGGVAHRHHLMPLGLQAIGEGLADVGFVVDDEDAQLLHPCHRVLIE